MFALSFALLVARAAWAARIAFSGASSTFEAFVRRAAAPENEVCLLDVYTHSLCGDNGFGQSSLPKELQQVSHFLNQMRATQLHPDGVAFGEAFGYLLPDALRGVNRLLDDGAQLQSSTIGFLTNLQDSEFANAVDVLGKLYAGELRSRLPAELCEQWGLRCQPCNATRVGTIPLQREMDALRHIIFRYSESGALDVLKHTKAGSSKYFTQKVVGLDKRADGEFPTMQELLRDLCSKQIRGGSKMVLQHCVDHATADHSLRTFVLSFLMQLDKGYVKTCKSKIPGTILDNLILHYSKVKACRNERRAPRKKKEETLSASSSSTRSESQMSESPAGTRSAMLPESRQRSEAEEGSPDSLVPESGAAFKEGAHKADLASIMPSSKSPDFSSASSRPRRPSASAVAVSKQPPLPEVPAKPEDKKLPLSRESSDPTNAFGNPPKLNSVSKLLPLFKEKTDSVQPSTVQRATSVGKLQMEQLQPYERTPASGNTPASGKSPFGDSTPASGQTSRSATPESLYKPGFGSSPAFGNTPISEASPVGGELDIPKVTRSKAVLKRWAFGGTDAAASPGSAKDPPPPSTDSFVVDPMRGVKDRPKSDSAFQPPPRPSEPAQKRFGSDCKGNASTASDALGYPTLQEYTNFVNVYDISVQLSDVARVGRKVAAAMKDEMVMAEWRASFKSMPYSQVTRFLHRPSSSALLKRMAAPFYAGKPLKGTKVAIVGGGPAGLRLAVELLLFGADVHIVESRRQFNRLNVLKLWKFTELDLVALGVKDLFAQLLVYKVKRIPIALLQHSLLRVALTLGAVLHPACSVEGLNADAARNGLLKVQEGCPSKAKLDGARFHAVIDGTGTSASLRNWHYPNNKSALIGSTKKDGQNEAIGLTMNFRRFGTRDENDFEASGDERFATYNPAASDEFSLAYQFAQSLFDSKAVALRDIVYWKSSSSHYVVATVTRDALIKFGVIDKPKSSRVAFNDLVKHPGKLPALGLKIAEEWHIPHASNESSDAFVLRHGLQPDVSLFEYGRTVQATDLARFLDKGVLFGLVGDTLETPFWPKGTGANHAMYSAYLQTLTILAWRRYSYNHEETLAFANSLWQQLRHMPIEGNPLGFDRNAYTTQITSNYANVESRGEVRIY